ncbi:hypothetical protein SBI_08227 [Streptomyces bingchenggensis BCW-1]|uniref:Heme-binding protein n=1 Tax=Streptomyces bingchenggensis (strain BCW-1) TaxID=749414 RepID=D7BQZ5_STRBB|nr:MULTISPECIES: heme-binding protein [Streptomyces]ADI11345.1 hypothetical protein SBI_08227 [Streptomyces bingchenggensis BCW-1]
MSTTAVTPLTSADAEALIAAARAAAGGAGIPVSVTALDAGGHLLAFRRDGHLIGAIGIGGGAPEQDHSFATTALEKLS